MEAKIKLIKKKDLDGAASPVAEAASTEQRDLSTSVKSWVKEFQEGRRDEMSGTFESLFSDSKP